jgi:hypothetical protein
MGSWTAYVEKRSRVNSLKQMHVKHVFAYVRPVNNVLGLLDTDHGWVVTRNTFDDVQVFDNLVTARVFVESLFALEYN